MQLRHKSFMILAGLLLLSTSLFVGCQADASTSSPTTAPASAPTPEPTSVQTPHTNSSSRPLSSLEGDMASGKVMFQTVCSACHGQDAMGDFAPKIVGKIAGEVQNALLSVEAMDFIELANQEIADVAAYLQQLE